MRLLMHSNSISERGTSTAIFEYAQELSLRGYDITVAYDRNNIYNHNETISLFNRSFSLYPYTSFNSLQDWAQTNVDAAYFLKAGQNDGLVVPGILNAVHAIFQHYEPHGDRYAYVSKWLSQTMARKNNRILPSKIRGYIPRITYSIPFVPHAVSLPSANQNLRSEFGVPSDAILGVRYGGFETFDVPWVLEEFGHLLDSNKDLWFVFLNTKPFIIHPRVKFLDANTDKQYKSNFLSSADFFLHARDGGETFGLAIVEAMSMKLPVLACGHGSDKNHTKILGPKSLFYSFSELEDKLSRFTCGKDVERNFIKSQEYTPNRVVNKFEQVFLR